MRLTSLQRAVVCLVGSVLAGSAPGVVYGQAQSRVRCTVVDEWGDPLAGVRIAATTKKTSLIKVECTTGDDGQCTIPLIDATMTYDVVLAKEGYQQLTVNLKIPFGETVEYSYLLASNGSAFSSRGNVTEEDLLRMQEGNRGVLRHNESVAAELAGDLDTALLRAQEAVRLDPTLVAAHVRLASLQLQLGAYPESAAAAEQALQLDPQSYEALHLRFDAYRLLGDKEKTAAAAAALAEAGSLPDAAARVFNEAVTDYNRGALERAKTAFLQAVELDPELVTAYAALANIYHQENDAANALAMADKVLEQDPGNAKAAKIRYLSLRSLGDETAGEALEAVRAVDPEWALPDLYNRASNLYNAGHSEQAREVLHQLLEIDPDYAEAHYLLGLCADVEGDREGTRKHLERFLELDPEHPEAEVAREILSYLQWHAAPKQSR